MCFLLTNNDQMSNTRATEKKSLGNEKPEGKNAAIQLPEERPRCSGRVKRYMAMLFLPTKSKSFGLLSFEEEYRTTLSER